MSLSSFASFTSLQGDLPRNSFQSKASAHAPNPSDMSNVSFVAGEAHPTKASLPRAPLFPPLPPSEEISDAALFEGFVFQPQEPFKPGQFTGFAKCSSPRRRWQELPRLQKDTRRRDPSPMKPKEFSPLGNLHSGSASPTREGSQIPLSLASRAYEETREMDGQHAPKSPSISQHSFISEHIDRANQGDKFGQLSSSKQASPRISSYVSHGESCQFGDPASEIGDLERPRCLNRSRSRHGRKQSTHSFRDIRGLGRSHRVGERIQRPQSKNSNTSKKRSRVEKSRYVRGAPEGDTFARRLYDLIQENQAKQLKSQDRIQCQEDVINNQEMMLREAFDKLDKAKDAFHDVKSRYKQAQEQESCLAAQNKALAQQIEGLHKEVSNLNAQRGESAEKCAAYRQKLNEAIDEQQRMYRHSQSQHEAAKAAFEKEQSERMHHSRRVDAALQKSVQKRVELKQLFDEHQQRTEADIQQKNEIIQELRNKAAVSDACSLREQKLGEQLQDMKSLQLAMDETVRRLESRFKSLAGLAPDQLTLNAELTAQISQKMNFIIEQIASQPKEVRCALGTGQCLESLENNIVARLLPTINHLNSKQTATEKIMMTHGKSFVTQLEWIQTAVESVIQRMNQVDHSNIRQGVDEVMHRMNATVSQAHQACVDMGHRLDALGASMREALRAGASSREAELQKQVDAQTVILSDRDHQLQALLEDFTAKFQLVEEQISRALTAIQQHLESRKEKEAFEQKLNDSDEMKKNLMTQLEESKSMLSECRAARAIEDETANQLVEERLTVSKLNEKIQQLEKEAIMLRELEVKCQMNKKSFEALQTKVAAALQRLPRVETMAAKLDHIGRTNSLLHRTDQYLLKQKAWIQQELSARNAYEDDIMVVDDELLEQAGDGAQSERFATQSQSASVAVGLQTYEHITTPLAPFIVECEDRKVLVRSPDGGSSHSPPLTIEQEKQRRREAHRPRSIMRFAPSSSAGHTSQEGQMAARGNMIEEIRAGFIPPEQSGSTGKLPALW